MHNSRPRKVTPPPAWTMFSSREHGVLLGIQGTQDHWVHKLHSGTLNDWDEESVTETEF